MQDRKPSDATVGADDPNDCARGDATPHGIGPLPDGCGIESSRRMAHGDCDSTPSWHERHPRLGFWIGAFVVYLVFFALIRPPLWRPGIVFAGGTHTQIEEARAWWSGRLNLTRRWHDTALADGRAYSHFPVMFSLVAAALIPFFGGIPYWFVAGVFVLPIPLLAYTLFHRLAHSPWWGAAGAICLVCGTSLSPVLDRTLRGASPYYVNHTLATIGLLVLLYEYFGRRRVAIAGLGLIIATLSRQLTVACALPLAWMAFQTGTRSKRRSRLATLTGVGMIVAGVPLTMNFLKFGNPFDSGYMRIYEGRDDDFARDARTYGLFSIHFVPRNLYFANIGFPRLYKIEIAGRPEYHLRPNTKGTGIWWTTPLLLWLFADQRRILRDPAARMVLVAGAMTFIALLFFHATGSEQPGFNRFSLDYVPAWLAVIMPGCFRGRRRWLGLAAVVWSVVYFQWLI